MSPSVSAAVPHSSTLRDVSDQSDSHDKWLPLKFSFRPCAVLKQTSHSHIQTTSSSVYVLYVCIYVFVCGRGPSDSAVFSPSFCLWAELSVRNSLQLPAWNGWPSPNHGFGFNSSKHKHYKFTAARESFWIDAGHSQHYNLSLSLHPPVSVLGQLVVLSGAGWHATLKVQSLHLYSREDS